MRAAVKNIFNTVPLHRTRKFDFSLDGKTFGNNLGMRTMTDVDKRGYFIERCSASLYYSVFNRYDRLWFEHSGVSDPIHECLLQNARSFATS